MRKAKRYKPSRQLVGNMGLYYVCYELSKRGWNVLPTSRNARGVDVVIYSQDAVRTHTIQIKALSKRNPVPLGSNIQNLISEYLIICRGVSDDTPEIFLTKISDIKSRIHDRRKANKLSYWLEPKDYEDLKDNWKIIGNGYD